MKINRKSRYIIISVIAIIVIGTAIFLVINKSANDKIKVNEKNKASIKTQELKKNSKEISKGKATTTTTTDTAKAGGNEAIVDNKDTTNKAKVQTTQQQQTQVAQQEKAKIVAQEKIETAKAVNSKDGIIVFVKDANFGSMAEIIKDNSKFSSYKYYQFFLGNKTISAMESITKGSTTIFPAEEAGTEVVIKLLGQDKKVIKELKTKLTTK